MANRSSRQSGFWDDPNTWANGSGGASHTGGAVSVPNSGDSIYISAGHTVTVRTDLSGAGPMSLNCDAFGANFGILAFDPTVNTGMNIQMQTVAAGATFTIQAGSRLTPINRGVTCTILANGTNHLRIGGGTLNVELWGRHRSMSNTAVYANILTVAANVGDTSITVSNTFNPVPISNSWLWLVEQNGAATANPKSELVQVQSYSAGVITLTKPLKYSYTTTFGLVYKANENLVNSILTSDHSSGTTWVLTDDIFPGGTGAGSLLITRAGSAANTNNLTSAYSSWSSGTKTWIGTAASAQLFEKSSIVLARDFNIIFRGLRTLEFGSTGTGVTNNWRFNYVDMDSWSNSTGLNGIIYYNTNFFDTLGINTGTLSNRQIFAYGLGFGLQSSVSSVNNVLSGSNITAGHAIFRSRFANSNQASTNLLQNMQFSYFEDVIAHSNRGNLLQTPDACIFKDCGFGASDGVLTGSVIENPTNCQFDNLWIWGSNNDGALQLYGSDNIFSNITFGKTPNGRVLNNSVRDIQAVNFTGKQLITGIEIASGEPAIFLNRGNTPIIKGLLKTTNINGVEQTFKNYFSSGTSESDFLVYEVAAPSVKITHTNNTDIVYHDIPIYLDAGLRTIAISTYTSTAIWIDAPRILLIKEEDSSLHGEHWKEFNSLATSVQSILTPSTWQRFSLNVSIPTSGVYVLRLISRNSSGTVNWDRIGIS